MSEPQQKASPEQQDAYTRTVLAGMKILYSEQTHAGIMQKLQSGADDPAAALADTAVLVMTQLDEKAGGKIPRDVIMHAAMEILSDIGELALKSGVLPVDEQAMQAAGQQMVQALVQQFGGDEMGQQQPGVQPAQKPGLIQGAMGGM